MLRYYGADVRDSPILLVANVLEMGEPKKFSFGFSKVVKKPTLIPAKPEAEHVEYIKCVEDKTVKLVNEEAAKPKPLPVIPMPPGSSVKDRILEAIKAREEAKTGKRGDNKTRENGISSEGVEKQTSLSDENLKNEIGEANSNGAETKPLTLDEMAAKELLETAKMDFSEEKKPDLVIDAKSDEATKKEATLDDYENMPIGDFGLAMLRGMGWDPKKGIGLNEKVVEPAAPQVRPKGMGLGADKAIAAQNPQSTAAEELVMKKGSMIKVVIGPNAGLYGKVEGFEELPGRITVRLALSNSLVSLSEFMVQLVGPTEYGKNAKVMNLDKYNAALDPGSKPPVKETPSKESKYRPRSPPSRRKSRSHSPRDYQGTSSSYSKSSKRDRSRDRTSHKRDKHRSESSDSDDYRRQKEERRHHKSSKKPKYRSDSSNSDCKSKKKSSRDKSSKHSKPKTYRSESDSDSNSRHRKKHKKSKKY